MVNIFTVPIKTKVNRSMKGKILSILGASKSGKSTLASQAPRPVFLCTENGTEAITGITPIPIASWSDFKAAVNQLCTEQGRNTFDTVVVDTATNLMLLLDKYIGQKLSTDKKIYEFGTESEFGKGSKAMRNELGIQLQKLANQGYLIIMIIHAENKIDFTTGKEYIGTSLTNSLYGCIEKAVDETIFLTRNIDKNGVVEHKIWFNPKGGFSGTGGRFPIKEDCVPCSYENLEKTLLNSIDSMGVSTVEQSAPTMTIEVEKFDFDELLNEFKNLTNKIMEENNENAPKITKIVEKSLGVGKKVNTMTSNQTDLLEEIIANLKQEFGV